jgi:hypothetical protein
MGSLAKKMNLRQRICGLAFDLRQFVQIPIALSYIILPFVLLSGSPLVFWTTRNELRVLIRLASTWSATHWLHNGVMGGLAAAGNDFTPYDIRIASYDSEMEQWLSPCTYLNVSKALIRHQTYTCRLPPRLPPLLHPPHRPRRRENRIQSLRQHLVRPQ